MQTSGAPATDRHGRAPSWALRAAGLVGVALIAQGAFIVLVVANNS